MNSKALIGPKTSTNGRRDASEFGGGARFNRTLEYPPLGIVWEVTAEGNGRDPKAEAA